MYAPSSTRIACTALPEKSDRVMAAVGGPGAILVNVPYKHSQPSVWRFAQQDLLDWHNTENVNRNVDVLDQLLNAIQEVDSMIILTRRQAFGPRRWT